MSDLSPIGISIVVAAAMAAVWLVLRLRRGKQQPDASRLTHPEAASSSPSDSHSSRIAPAPDSSEDDSAAAKSVLTPTGRAIDSLQDRDRPAGDPAEPPTRSANDVNVSAPPGPTEEDRLALRQGLKTTRSGFMAGLSALLRRQPTLDGDLVDEIEETLLSADIGVATTQRILAVIQAHSKTGALGSESAVWTALRKEVHSILSVPSPPISLEGTPSLILVAGVNGVGKTTTIGKLASRYTAQGKRVLLAAGDTYRAAAVLQLEVWGKRVNCPVVKGKEGADPGSVIFDAVSRARQEGYDLVLADTAGRLHTQQPLMEELKKVNRTVTKALGGKLADEILLVLDATTGQNAVQQMHMFREALAISGVVLTKLDGTAKGGVVLGIVDEHKVPVRFVGLGERVEDLREFDAESFVSALFEEPEEYVVSTQSA